MQNQRDNMKNFFCLLLLILSYNALAEIVSVDVSAEFTYGPAISQNKACEAASQRATTEAVRQIYGEKLSSSQQVSCKEEESTEDNTNCVYHSYLWNTIDGEIRSSREISREIETVGVLSRCTVKLAIEVKKSTEKSDPSFDFQVRLNQNIYRNEEELIITIEPSKKMYMTIFGWYPYNDEDTVKKELPTEGDNYFLNEVLKIPSERALRKRAIQVSFPKNIERSFVDEHLIFVASKKPINWLKTYQFDEFKKRLTELKKSEKRIHQISYKIVK